MLLSWTLPVERRIDENGIESVRPVADVIDAGQEYRVVVEMPGVDKEGLEIEVKDDVLRVRGQRTAPDASARLLLNERYANRVYERRFTLGEDIDRDKLRARLEHGVLTVTLPRKAAVQPQRIEVEVG